MFNKEKKRLMVVKADCSHCNTMEEREAYLQVVKQNIIDKLTGLKRDNLYDVLVIPQTVDILVVN